MTERTHEEIIKNIKWVLEDKIKPSVAQHNGVMNFISFEEGVSKLEMAGACSGCAMSKQTLQQGVEDMLKHYVPEVLAIVGEDDAQAKEKGYEPYIPRNEYPEFDSDEEKRLQGLIEKEYSGG